MRRMFRFTGFIAVFIAALVFAEPAAAQVISEIRVEGNQRIEPETVRSYMVIAPGSSLRRFDPTWSLRRATCSIQNASIAH